MELVEPSIVYKDSFIAAVREFQAAEDTSIRTHHYYDVSVSELENDFAAHVERLQQHAHGEELPNGWVSNSTFWLVDDGVFVGRVNIRHRLTEHLGKIGGHIGYDIRPSKRGNGYGTAMLRLALPKARERGIERVLVTCDAANIASRKIIEKNGGVLENAVTDPETGTEKLRFWIESNGA